MWTRYKSAIEKGCRALKNHQPVHHFSRMMGTIEETEFCFPHLHKHLQYKAKASTQWHCWFICCCSPSLCSLWLWNCWSSCPSPTLSTETLNQFTKVVSANVIFYLHVYVKTIYYRDAFDMTINNTRVAFLSTQAAPHLHQSPPPLPGCVRFLHRFPDALSDSHHGRLLGSQWHHVNPVLYFGIN